MIGLSKQKLSNEREDGVFCFGSSWSQWFGVGLGAAGLILVVWVHHTLRRHWSTNLLLKEEHTLVTGGPYRWARHPMYTALLDFSQDWHLYLLAGW